MLRGPPAAALALALGAVAASAHAETLADAVALAYQSNPQLQAQRAQVRALDETYVQARAGWRPTATAQITGSYSKSPQAGLFGGVSQVESNVGDAVLGVTQPIYTGGRTAASVRASEADILAARQTLRATEAAVLQQVVSAYADVVRDRALLAIRERDVAVLQGEVDDAMARLRAGEVTATDVAQTRTQLAQSRSGLSLAQGQLQVSRAAYAAVVGQNPGDLAPPPPLPGTPATVDQAFDAAEQENPGLRQAVLTEEASRARVSVARAADRPTLSVNAQIGYSGALTPFYGHGYDRAVSAVASLTQPLFTGGVNASNIRRALELNTSDRIGVEANRRNAVQGVSQAWNQMISDRAAVVSETDHVKVARDYFAGTQAEFTVGQRSTLDVVIAEQSLIGAEVTLTQVSHDAYVAEASLLAAVGRLEARYLVPGSPLYDPAAAFRHVAHAGAVPWEGAVALIDNLGAPAPRADRPIPAPAIDGDARIAVAGDPVGAHPTPATASPTSPVAGTTSPATPETLGRGVGAPQDPASLSADAS